MNNSTNAPPTTRPRPAPITTKQTHAGAERTLSVSSESSRSSASSQVTMLSLARPISNPSPNPAASTAASALSRVHLPPRTSSRDVPLVQSPTSVINDMPTSPTMPDHHRLRARQHSQGFFEPSLRTTHGSGSSSNGLTASAIAAQAAMHQVQNIQHNRRRSQILPAQAPAQDPTAKRKPGQPNPLQTQGQIQQPTTRDFMGNAKPPTHVGERTQAASAAASAYPVSPILSPQDQNSQTSPVTEQHKSGISRMKLFSKGKTLQVSKDREGHRMMGALSPTKMGVYGSSTLPRNFSHSTTSLVDSATSGPPSLYSSTNASSSTLVLPQEKERHRPHFLSRQKHKLGSYDQFNLPLSSASSNSRPADPSAPQSLYSFAPPSPGPSATFNKSISGLDLRHGGRAFREKKREGAANADGLLSDNLNPSGSVGTMFGPASSSHALTPEVQGSSLFGIPNMSPDEAWPFLKSRLLGLFDNEGEIPRMPVEDLNRLVSVHIQLCYKRRAPSVIIEDVRELLQAGFSSVDQTLRRIPDDRLVPHLVEIWLMVFGTILPFLQAVFLPLDHEFKGRGTIMSPREAADFWGALPIFSNSSIRNTPRNAPGYPQSSFNPSRTPVPQISLGEVLDVRTLVLLAFRGTVILPRHDVLLNIFSRLSLDSINGFATSSDRLTSPTLRPGTSGSSGSGGNSDPHSASYNSQNSHFLDSSNIGSIGARSRATSNTSAGSFQSVSAQRPQPGTFHAGRGQGQQSQPMDSAKVTQTAARMLQCVSVLAALQTPEATVSARAAAGLNARTTTPIPEETDIGNDYVESDARKKMERLAKELKLNWLGRGRTGRQRRGFVGTKVRHPVGLGIGVGA